MKKITVLIKTILLFLLLTGCLWPVPITRTATGSFEQQNLQIDAVFNELMGNKLTICINQKPVIDQSLGNPIFPPYSKDPAWKKSLITYQPLHGNWQGHFVRVESSKGTVYPGSQLYPDCKIFIDDQLICVFSF
ncbi:hypothetical protein [Tichowtungia aerotolerans]|uniref:Lipoprotein n=1 Tax=Tichowtungia aerotolerans TaxID=2697043 RepID=A0A6P1M9K9_9BACT|nr:hypothetical protein [Tichowtungia aerotolerans]QHI70712.1 hypothetical protein GT409_15115 [Tichowtungia aerotolerans]